MFWEILIIIYHAHSYMRRSCLYTKYDVTAWLAGWLVGQLVSLAYHKYFLHSFYELNKPDVMC